MWKHTEEEPVGDREAIQKRKLGVVDERWLRNALKRLGERESAYENRIAAIVAKLIIRGELNEPAAAES